jgi:phosphoglycerate dehydrogenase-like enzyme
MASSLGPVTGESWLPPGASGAKDEALVVSVSPHGRTDSMKVVYHGANALMEHCAGRFPHFEHRPVPADRRPTQAERGDVLVTIGLPGPGLDDLLAFDFRWIHCLAAGVDSFPLERVGDRMLTCSRGALAIPIAEWAFAQILGRSKRVCEERLSAPPTEWSAPRRPLGALHGSVLAVLGLGSIGNAVAQFGLAFGMSVRGLRRRTNKTPPPGIEMAKNVAELFDGATAMVLAAPLTKDTRGMVDAAALRGVRPGAHLVNVARGALVDSDALRISLEEGCLGFASLDTFDPEPVPSGHWAYSHPNVSLTPHVAWNAPDSWNLLTDCFVDKLRKFERGEPLDGVVDRVEGY